MLLMFMCLDLPNLCHILALIIKHDHEFVIIDTLTPLNNGRIQLENLTKYLHKLPEPDNVY